MSNITLYTKPDCVQCEQTKRLFEREGIKPETVIDVTEDDAALAHIKDLGYLQAPVVVLKDDEGAVTQHWSGFRPDIIMQM